MKYFDFAATTPLDLDAAEVYTKVATDHFGNASSLHDIGYVSNNLLENCRAILTELMGISKEGLFFTSGGSEANFLCMEALLSASMKKGKHIIIGMAEHSSIHGIAKRLEADGFTITYLPLKPSGFIDMDRFINAIMPETVLVVIQHVNSEIGTIQPIEEIGRVCREHDILLHSDMVQSFGKIDVRNVTPWVSSCSISAHKIYGPKGIGMAYVDPKIAWRAFFPETTHEKGFRPGTLNVPAIAAMTEAAKKIVNRQRIDEEKFVQFRHTFIEKLQPINNQVVIYQADQTNQLPSIIGMRVKGVEGQWMMLEANRLGYAISTGSACQAGMQKPAKIMNALGVEAEDAKGFFRISFGHGTSLEDVEKLGEAITEITKRLHAKD
ncbi:IscS subfamily cysteine desulfurase [Saliterribacillus persicus]|uniref:Cysteine desulfurase n=1 Tax=Saliterribacillus persicus TaxID=930114 RepID=A0A368YFR2_9BACI|nr:IscS subfamily cysteine desulfurase [Saliterribacillus persicus]RCW77024.1 cysteine desulfurase [Saliterribacillus persicus]